MKNKITVLEGNRPLLVIGGGMFDESQTWLFDTNQKVFFCFERMLPAVLYQRRGTGWKCMSTQPEASWQPVKTTEMSGLLDEMENEVVAWEKDRPARPT
jgi:hypothetical protein